MIGCALSVIDIQHSISNKPVKKAGLEGCGLVNECFVTVFVCGLKF